MKIIDLLNKIANGKEVPKKIKWEDTIFIYSEYDKDYLEYPLSDEEYQGLFCMKDSTLTKFLNDEVEILEEEKKIQDIEKKEKYKNVVEKTKKWLKEESERLHNICGDNWTTVGQTVYKDVLNKMEKFENES